MTLAEIRKARQLLGLTQPQFGKLLHATGRTVRMWESGQRNMAPATQDLLQRIMTERELEYTLSAPALPPGTESRQSGSGHS
jgi:DNA-binding transcriptional regulator YiaG